MTLQSIANPLRATQSRARLAQGLIWLIPLFWTVNSVIARKAPHVITPNLLALGRWALAGLVLAFMARSELWRQRSLLRLQWHRYVLLGACGMWICGAWVYQAGRSTVMMNISLIYAAAPVLIAIGSVLWMGEHFSRRQMAGVVLAMAGVVHVVVQGEWLRLSSVQWVAGDLWIVGAAVSWAAYALLQKRWPTPMGATAHLAAICAGGVLVLLPFGIWEFLQPETPALGIEALGMVVVAALVPGVGAYWIYGWTQKILGASSVAMTLYLGPLYSALVAWLFVDEMLGWHHLVGGLLILCGVALVIRKTPS